MSESEHVYWILDLEVEVYSLWVLSIKRPSRLQGQYVLEIRRLGDVFFRLVSKILNFELLIFEIFDDLIFLLGFSKVKGCRPRLFLCLHPLKVCRGRVFVPQFREGPNGPIYSHLIWSSCKYIALTPLLSPRLALL